MYFKISLLSILLFCFSCSNSSTKSSSALIADDTIAISDTDDSNISENDNISVVSSEETTEDSSEDSSEDLSVDFQNETADDVGSDDEDEIEDEEEELEDEELEEEFIPEVSYDPTAFITKWQTDKQESDQNSITLPLVSNGTYDFIVEWGDGTSSHITNWDDLAKKHDYAEEGTYTVSITGIMTHFEFNNTGDRNKLLEISNWGDIEWESFSNSFYGCNHLTISAIDSPDLDNVTSLENMFRDAFVLNSDLSDWDTSNITNMKRMFYNAENLNQDLSSWDTSSVIKMKQMFFMDGERISAFNQDLTSWDVDNVIDINNYTNFLKASRSPDWDSIDWPLFDI